MTLESVPDGTIEARRPATPRGLKAAGKRLFLAVVGDFELDPQGLELLGQACRTVDKITVLDAVAERDGPMCESSQGARVHPAIVEARQQRALLARLIGSLGLDFDEPADDAAAKLDRSARGRAAARARWGTPGAAA